MGSFFLPSVRLLHIFIIFLPCFFNSVISTNHKASLLPPLTPLLPPILSPLLPPIIPQLLNFTDERLSSVYPIIQSFKNIITSDPLGITITWVGSDICSYKGFYCDTPPDNATATAIASIDFNGFRLSAPSVEGFIDQFPDLALFHANSNNFSGILTPKIANLKHLYELDISNNNFNGPFPTALLTMNTLTFLDIRYNSFTGSIPPQIFRQNLDVLFLNNNKFIKTLPDSIGDTPALYLTLANNKLSGQIPKTIGDASPTLLEALLLNNLLSGCIPYELGFLKDSTFFDAGRNRLTGPLPASLGCMDKMEQLNLADNFLYGRVPEVVCELGSLVNFSLSNNYFTGVGVECRKLMEKGVLDLRRNCIEGIEDQRSKEECDAFFSDSKTCKRPETYSLIPCNKVSRRSKRKSAPSLDVSKQRLL